MKASIMSPGSTVKNMMTLNIPVAIWEKRNSLTLQ